MQCIWCSNFSCSLELPTFILPNLIFYTTVLIVMQKKNEDFLAFTPLTLSTVCFNFLNELSCRKNYYVCCFDFNLQICSTVQFLPWRTWEGIYMCYCDLVFMLDARVFQLLLRVFLNSEVHKNALKTVFANLLYLWAFLQS